MSKKIIGVTVGTPISPKKIEDKINPVKTVNGKAPDKNGNVEVESGGIPQYGIYIGANLRGMTVCFEQIGYVGGSGYEVMFKAGDDFEIFAEDDYYQVTIEGVTEGHSTGGFNAFSYTFPDQDYIVSAYDENVLKAMKFEDAKVSRAVGDEDGNSIRETYAKKNEIPSVPVKSVNSKTGAVVLNADDVGARASDWMPTAAEVGARPSTWMPTASEVGARPNTWTPSYSEVGADKSGAAASAVSGHNTSDSAHNDIRLLIAGLVARLDALANSDDTTLDQMAEVVKYIKDNRDLISQITTDKVSVSDIVNNTTTNVSNRPLSAAQGVALKALIDAITVPTKLSELSADASHRTVTDTEKAAWNAKSNFSGAYKDLTGQPTIPTVPTKVSAFENDKGYLTDFTESDPTVPSWAKASSKPSYTKSEVGLSNVDNVKQYSASNPPPYPVKSVNGKTGAVSLALADLNLTPEPWTLTLKSGDTVTKKVVLA